MPVLTGVFVATPAGVFVAVGTGVFVELAVAVGVLVDVLVGVAPIGLQVAPSEVSTPASAPSGLLSGFPDAEL